MGGVVPTALKSTVNSLASAKVGSTSTMGSTDALQDPGPSVAPAASTMTTSGVFDVTLNDCDTLKEPGFVAQTAAAAPDDEQARVRPAGV